jgi:hypothetical protein
MTDKIKILFLASNPTDTGALRLGEESRQIDERLQMGSERDRFQLLQHHAVRVTDLQHIMLRHQPHIVHFCGHGGPGNELILENQEGTSHAVSKKALTSLFEILNDNIKVVVLNACFSKLQAKALHGVIDYTVGMSKEVGDEQSIRFAGAFYQGLAFGRTVETAFKLAKNEIELVRLPGADTPELFVRPKVNKKRSLIDD